MSMENSPLNEEAAITSSTSADEGDNQFVAPPSEESQSGTSSQDQFTDPEGLNELDAQSIDIESSSEAQTIIRAKAEIEQRLAESAATGAMSMASAQNLDSPGVLGVGISTGGSTGGIPGQPALVVYVENEGQQEQVRREIVDVIGVRAAASEDLPIEIEVTGEIEAYTSNRSRFRPAPAGVSVGHYRITAGTIGGWARGNGSRSNRLLMVSNNHVLANSNQGRFGDSVIQPGAADHGANPRDRIAILERYVPINFTRGAINYVDCATGWCWPSMIRSQRDHVYHSGTRPYFFKVGRSIVQPRVNMVVGKSGRTTNLTQGLIRAVGVSVNVNFGSAGIGHFRDQFSVRSTRAGDFSAGGDSGSFVWEWRSGLPPVGLLFAGGGGTTFCNRISRVLAALNISLL
jgi:hypothetical protein